MRLALILATTCTLLALFVLPTSAQLNLGGTADFGISYQINEENVEDGDIVVSTGDGGGGATIRATESYSNRLLGVVQREPVILFRTADATESGRPVAQSGITEVNVTTLNGPIKQGDYITSSEIAGKGKRADRSGYALGIAMIDFPGGGNDPSTGSGQGGQKFSFDGKEYVAGKISVSLKIEYAEITTARTPGRLLEYVGASLFRNVKDPQKFAQTMRYIAAGAVVVLAFGVGFATFSKGTTKGIEAIGRNPLAKNVIYGSILMNIFLTVLTTAVGVGAAFLILRL